MADFTREPLSGATDGKNVAVVATATPGTLIHTAHATAKDHIYLWVTNRHTANVDLTLEFGGVANADQIIFTVKNKDGLYLIVPGLMLTNTLVLRAFGSVASVLNVNGYVDRLT